MVERFKQLVEEYPEHTYLIIAFADVTFKFPQECRYPNLCVNVDGFGLINPLEGRTVASLPEIHLAKYLGAELVYHDAVVIDSYEFKDVELEHEENYVFRSHLRNLIKLRKEAKEQGFELLQQLYKEYCNSLYGKVAQGISEKNTYNVRDGGTARLPKSEITNAYYATMITGLIRAALSELLVAINELIEEGHNYKIISATTDGILYGIDSKRVGVGDVLNLEHTKYESTFEALKAGYNKFNSFEAVDVVLAKKIEKFPSLQLLNKSHEAWGNKEFIEIKHVANILLDIKTRGQVGHYEEE